MASSYIAQFIITTIMKMMMALSDFEVL